MYSLLNGIASASIRISTSIFLPVLAISKKSGTFRLELSELLQNWKVSELLQNWKASELLQSNCVQFRFTLLHCELSPDSPFVLQNTEMELYIFWDHFCINNFIFTSFQPSENIFLKITSDSPVVVKNTLNVCICGRIRDGGCARLVGDQGVEGVHHGQQVHHLRLVLRQVLSVTKL